MSAGTKRSLGELLVLDIEEVPVVAKEEYPIAGIYSFGRGLFARASIMGSDTSYKKLHRLHSGQLVVSRLKAFEGALGMVPQEFDGWFLSPEFPTFSCVEGELDPRYLAHICGWSDFWSMLATTSKGIGARRERVHAEDLLRIELRVPPVDEQRRQAAYLDTVANWAGTAAERLARRSPDSFIALLPGLVDADIRGESVALSKVGDVADFISDTVHPGDDPAPADSFVGLQHIESHTGRCLGSDPLGTMKGRKFRFRPGDVLYGYLRPYLNKVWAADRHGLCSVDQYVLRPHSGVSAGLLAHSLRGSEVLSQAVDLTHSLQLPRLRSGLLTSLKVPTVPEGDTPSLVLHLDQLRDRLVTAAAWRRHQDELAAALLPGALNQVFVGLN